MTVNTALNGVNVGNLLLKTLEEPPADCLLSWWHLAQFFAGDGTRDLMVWRNRVTPPAGQPLPPRSSAAWADDSTAVVQREDVSDKWVQRVQKFATAHGVRGNGTGSEGRHVTAPIIREGSSCRRNFNLESTPRLRVI